MSQSAETGAEHDRRGGQLGCKSQGRGRTCVRQELDKVGMAEAREAHGPADRRGHSWLFRFSKFFRSCTGRHQQSLAGPSLAPPSLPRVASLAEVNV